MANAEWVGIVLSQGEMVRTEKDTEFYQLDSRRYKFNTRLGTMRKMCGVYK